MRARSMQGWPPCAARGAYSTYPGTHRHPAASARTPSTHVLVVLVRYRVRPGTRDLDSSASIRLGVRSDPPGVRSDPRDGRPRAAGQHGGRMPSVPHVQHLAGKRMSSAFHWCTVHRCQTKIFVRGGRTNPTVPQNKIGIPTGKGDLVSFGGVTVEF